MEKVTTKQRKFIADLSEEHQVSCPDLEEMSKNDAFKWIHDVLNNEPETDNKVLVKINPAQWGLALKMVYLNWMNRGDDMLHHNGKFLDQVKETYSLFEIK